MTNISRESRVYESMRKAIRPLFAAALTIVPLIPVGTSVPTQAQTLPDRVDITVLWAFTGKSDGAQPTKVREANGSLYTTTQLGGDLPGCGGNGCGTVLTTDGKPKVLHTFKGGVDGGLSYGGLVPDAAGNLYGSAYTGGDLQCTNLGSGYQGCGVVFRVDKAGKYKVLYAFKGGDDGAGPVADVTIAPDGSLYGVTHLGGSGACSNGSAIGCGTVFKVDKSGNETVLYTFAGGAQADGANPWGTLALDGEGNLYGVTNYGGSGSCGVPTDSGCGTVFKIDRDGNETVLYPFTGESDGGVPQGDLALDAKGNLYGTTSSGGHLGKGVVFKLPTTGGQDTVLYSFTGGADGSTPNGGVILYQGDLYGTTEYGGLLQDCNTLGARGCGVVFKEAVEGGQDTVLYSFTGQRDGGIPIFTLTVDAKGNFFGTTLVGGNLSDCSAWHGCGTAFMLTIPTVE